MVLLRRGGWFVGLLLVVAFGSLESSPRAHAEMKSAAIVPADSASPVSNELTLPEGLEVAVPTLLPMPSDRQLLVVHAPASNRRAILYMHGLCGDVRAVEAWADVAAASGTLIAVLGDRACGGGRFKWGKNWDVIEARLQAALAAVKVARGGLLDTDAPVLFGYSQGADRAEVLVARNARRYRRVVLGGASRGPRLARLGATEAVAMFGGELEVTGHMRAGAEVLAAAGKPARFFLLPGAKHGQFGPDGKRVMNELFAWLLADGT